MFHGSSGMVYSLKAQVPSDSRGLVYGAVEVGTRVNQGNPTHENVGSWGSGRRG